MKLDNEPRLSGVGPSMMDWARSVAQAVNAALMRMAKLAPLESPVLTGEPKAPSPSADDDSTRLATTSWVRSAMASIATAAGFEINLSPNGFIRLPSWLGGWMAQWVYALNTNNLGTGYSRTTWPTAFPTACLRVATSCATSSGKAYAAGHVNTVSQSAASIDWVAYNAAGTPYPSASQLGVTLIGVGH